MIWDRLTEPRRAAIEEAWVAYVAGCIPIGAVITDCQGRLAARGRNRLYKPPSSQWPLAGSTLAHAELQALHQLGYDPDRAPLALYTTTEPCPMCLGACRMGKMYTIHYASRDPWAGSVALLEMAPFASRDIRAMGPEDPLLEAVLLAIQEESHLRRERPAWGELVEADPACAAGVQLGREVYASGELAGLCAKGVGAAEVIEALARRAVEARNAALAPHEPVA